MPPNDRVEIKYGVTGTDEAAKQVDNVNEKIVDTGKAAEKAEAKVEDLNRAIDKNTKSTRPAAVTAEELNKAFVKVDKSTVTSSKSVDKAKQSVDDLSQVVKVGARGVIDMADSAESLSKNVRNVASASETAAPLLASLGGPAGIATWLATAAAVFGIEKALGAMKNAAEKAKRAQDGLLDTSKKIVELQESARAGRGDDAIGLLAGIGADLNARGLIAADPRSQEQRILRTATEVASRSGTDLQTAIRVVLDAETGSGQGGTIDDLVASSNRRAARGAFIKNPKLLAAIESGKISDQAFVDQGEADALAERRRRSTAFATQQAAIRGARAATDEAGNFGLLPSSFAERENKLNEREDVLVQAIKDAGEDQAKLSAAANQAQILVEERAQLYKEQADFRGRGLSRGDALNDAYSGSPSFRELRNAPLDAETSARVTNNISYYGPVFIGGSDPFNPGGTTTSPNRVTE